MVRLTRELIGTRLQSEPVLSPAARRRQGTSPLPRVLGADSEKGTAMQYVDTIDTRGVTVMRQTDGALLCRLGTQHRWIAPTQLQPGSTVAGEGDVSSMTDPLAVGTGDRVTFPDVLMAGDTGLQLDRYSPLRERMISLRGSRLLLLGILLAPLVMAGYVGLTVLLFLPLLGLRMLFPRRSIVWHVATRSA